MTEAEQQAKKKSTLGYTLDVNHESGEVILSMFENGDGKELNRDIIYQQLTAENIQHWHLDESNLKEAVKKHSRNIAISLRIAERINAVFHIQIAEDEMSALVQYTPAFGGKEPTADEIVNALIQKNVDPACINRTALVFLLDKKQPNTVTAAQGKPPRHGQNSRFIALIDKDIESNAPPQEKDDGSVDFLAGKTYLSVAGGTPLLQRIPPTPGTPGKNVLGAPIPPDPGKEVDFATKKDGCEFASNDENLLVASVDGHPVFSDNGVYVDDSLILDNVNVATGHVEFDGSIHIKGDVMPDMKVIATGDIFVKGVVERAFLQAGNNILVAGGIVGGISAEDKAVLEKNSLPDANNDDDEEGPTPDALQLPVFQCTLKATGSIEARYVNLAQLVAEKNIEIREYAFNSELDAGRNILLGQNGGKGNIVGGEARAGHAIVAKTLGNQAYLHSHFRVGLSQKGLKQLRHLKFLRQQRIDQARSLRTLLNELKEQAQKQPLSPKHVAKATKIHDTLLQLQDDIRKLDGRLKQLKIAHYDEDEPRISATSRCYPNCFITLNGAFRRVTQEHTAICYVKRGNRIQAKS